LSKLSLNFAWTTVKRNAPSMPLVMSRTPSKSTWVLP
jgi:hypothetical protein